VPLHLGEEVEKFHTLYNSRPLLEQFHNWDKTQTYLDQEESTKAYKPAFPIQVGLQQILDPDKSCNAQKYCNIPQDSDMIL
jgi:hypothetical protein